MFTYSNLLFKIRGELLRCFCASALMASDQNGSAIAQNPTELRSSEQRYGKTVNLRYQKPSEWWGGGGGSEVG